MDHLASRGFPSAMPARTHDGGNLVTLNGKPAALTRRLTGQSVLFANLEQCRQVGRALGELPVAAQSYAGHCDNSRGALWREQTGRLLARQTREASIRKLTDAELAQQMPVARDSLPQGGIPAKTRKISVEGK